ncbi:MAG: indolepyruvate oxidoreductase subunit beta [Thermofilum sp.]|jgi:indolepyruvate ferredoxin oxidoreductase beta subunit|uniref:indolepyruvate oxidoreductase subunit beta n=1 Tax=Thermofilum sp. TaxID=1961369 RepID=UPI002583E0BD|nr:indolepyruvate oxidoreductase subunit beta [Thermofilum sp.]MCI4407939.1 indolepyruvate oxidoreductase subunit beta [Thermofilum sp.]
MGIRSIVVTGIGGQGQITIGTILGQALLRKGYNVRVGEVHGLSQRGGSVVVFVKYGKGVPSSIVTAGEADALIGLEMIESLRRVPLVSRDGLLIVNEFFLPPPASKPVNRKDVEDALKSIGTKTVFINANELALKAGSQIASNIVMVGALVGSGKVDLTLEDVSNVLSERFKGKTLEINMNALRMGYEYVTSQGGL